LADNRSAKGDRIMARNANACTGDKRTQATLDCNAPKRIAPFRGLLTRSRARQVV